MAEEAQAPKPQPRLLRAMYCLIQVVSLAVFDGLCWLAPPYEKIFKDLDMQDLPIPTEAFLALSRFVRSPLGSGTVALLAGILIVLGLKGAFDRILRKLIIANVVLVGLLITFVPLSLHLPIVKIQEAIKER